MKKQHEQSPITVIDNIMGSGKTTMSIEFMNRSSGQSFLYITPFLKETNRVTSSVSHKCVYEPINYYGSKANSLKKLLREGKNISTTHALFSRMDKECMDILAEQDYVLYIDETLQCIKVCDCCNDDLNLLIAANYVSGDSDNRLIWNPQKSCADIAQKELKDSIQTGYTFISGSKPLSVFPPEVFSLFKQVYILTYLFEGSLMKYYFDAFNIHYTKKSFIKRTLYHSLVDYAPPKIPQYKDLINIHEGAINTNYSDNLNAYSLSSSWYKNPENAIAIKQLKNNIVNYYKNIQKAPSNTCLWSTYKHAENALSGPGYKKRFIPFNTIATNDYIDTYNLVYAVNIFPDVSITTFLQNRGVKVDADLYATHIMLQWIWRSRIRQGESINIYLPCERMRTLLKTWIRKISE